MEPETISGRESASAGEQVRRFYQFEFLAKFGEIFRLTLVTAFFTIITLGIYRFWGRTRVRQFLWQRTRLLDAPLEYTGTGGELFRGFLKVFFLVLIPLGLIDSGLKSWDQSLAQEAEEHVRDNAIYWPVIFSTLARWAYVALIFFLIGAGAYTARRYRQTRSYWRGVRANQGGKAWAYGLRYMGWLVAMLFSLGLVTPLRNASLWRYRYSNTWFGDRRFDSDASARGLYGTFLVCWLLAIPTLLMSLAWYRAKELRQFTAATRFEGLSFQLDTSGSSLLGLFLGNTIITVLTLTLGAPIVQWRQARYTAERLYAVGTVDLEHISRDLQSAPASGEGLAEAFLDGGF